MQTQQIQLSPTYDDSHDRRARLTALLAQRLGSNWQVDHVQNGVATVINGDPSSRPLAREVALNPGVTEKQGDQIAAWLGSQGLDLIELVQRAQLTAVAGVLTPSTRALRQRYAQVLRCHPWELELAVSWAVDEGAELGHIARVEIVRAPSTGMDSETRMRRWRGLVEVTPGGSPAWLITEAPDGAVALAHRAPAALPSTVPIERVLPERVTPDAWGSSAFGIDTEGRVVAHHLAGGPHVLLGGPTDSGKTAALTTMIASRLMTGHDLLIVDPVKGVDFEAFRPFALGIAETYAEAATALQWVLDEAERRKQVLRANRAVKWMDLDEHVRAAERIKPLTIVVDELSQLLLQIKEDKLLPEDDPLRVRQREQGLAKARIDAAVGEIARAYRFVGMFLLLATQKPLAQFMGTNGTELRSNCSNTAYLHPPGAVPDRGSMTLLFDTATEPAARALEELDDGHNRGLAATMTEAGQMSATRVAYAPAARVEAILRERGVPVVTPLEFSAPTASTAAPPPTPPGEAGLGWTPGQTPPPPIDWGT